MGKNAQVRLTETFKYLDKISTLPVSAYSKFKSAKKNDLAASKRISLGGGSRGTTTPAEKRETQRRHALRGLLLCMDWFGGQAKIPQAKTHFDKISESAIKTAIHSFFPIQGKGASAVVSMAKTVKPNAGQTIGMDNFYKCYREAITGNKIKIGTACYESVNLWMYLAGVTSLKWIKENGAQPGHQLPTFWNWSQETTSLDAAKNIPAGHIVRFLRGIAGLHYTVSIGNGKCVGNHNSIDVCKEWIREYGTAPTGHTSEFSIAGYLATMQALNKNPDPNSTPSVRSAPIVPKAPF